MGKPEDHVDLKPISKYKEAGRIDDSNWHNERELRKKLLPPDTDFKGLPQYEAPTDYRQEFVRVADRYVVLKALLKSKLPLHFNINTYWERWRYLLWHEELQIESVHVTSGFPCVVNDITPI